MALTTGINTTENKETKILNILSDTYPNLDCGPGTPIYEMVVRPNAMLWSRQDDGIEELVSSLDLSDVENMEEEDLDRVLSMFFMSRRSGNQVTGVVRVIFGSKVDIYISAGEIWEASGGRTYSVQTDHFITSGELPGNDVDGYYVDVSVVSTGFGDIFNATTNETVTVTGVSSPYVRRAYFLTDTTDGGIIENNFNFYNRAKDELSSRSLYSFRNVKAMLRDRFTTINEVVPIGLKDDEMIRDLVNIRGYGTVHIGGKCDIYVRPNRFKIASGYATPLGFPMTFNSRNITVDPEELMQAWNAANLVPADTALRGSVKEVIPLLTPASPMTSLTSDIQAIEDFVNNTDNNSLHTDNLVKQMWPLIVTVKVKISDTNASEAIATAKTTIAAYVNSLYGERAPQVGEIIHLLRESGINQVHLPVDLKCYYLTEDLRIECIGLNGYRQPSDTILRPTEIDSLKFLIDDRSQISLRTCCWYTSEDLIKVEVNS